MERPELALHMGSHYVSDFVKEQPTDREQYPLDLYFDESLQAVRLHNLAPPNTMWGQYWYRSGINQSMRNELQRIVTEVTERVKLDRGDIWLDIACNDGTLLSMTPEYCQRIGIDPCDDSYLVESRKHGTIVQDYFSAAAYFKSGAPRSAKVITCIAMFYDLDDPRSFVKDLYDVLDDNGVLVLQMSYTPLMVKQLAFDNICHEHTYYYNLHSIESIFSPAGFRIVDCSLNDTNGGSFRVYLQKNTADVASFATAPQRDVCDYRVESIFNLECEPRYDIMNPALWENFNLRLQQLKAEVTEFVDQALAEGKTVWGYGASTKGNTLLQYFGLDHTKITAIAERSPYKFGYRTIGTNIPIVSEEEMRVAQPDYLLVLPWHFIDEFERREADYLDKGGALLVPCPNFRIVKR
jgi:NDP-4-keto-2,6-dideoxyhexose 3-C-methyltransferase